LDAYLEHAIIGRFGTGARQIIADVRAHADE
jgi:hypothetical protein